MGWRPVCANCGFDKEWGLACARCGFDWFPLVHVAVEQDTAAAGDAKALPLGRWVVVAPAPAKRELTEDDKAVHRAIAVQDRSGNRMGAYPWMAD